MTSSLGHGWSKLASVALLFEVLRDFYKKCFWTKFGNMQKFVLGFHLKINCEYAFKTKMPYFICQHVSILYQMLGMPIRVNAL